MEIAGFVLPMWNYIDGRLHPKFGNGNVVDDPIL
jgi:hypothetical protein